MARQWEEATCLQLNRARDRIALEGTCFERGEIDFAPQTWRIGQLDPAVVLLRVSAFG